MKFAEKMTKSDDKVDNRLINLYRVRKAHQMGIHLGFNNPYIDNERNRAQFNFDKVLKDDIFIPLSTEEKEWRR